MKKNIILSLVLTLASIDYLVHGFTLAAVFTACLSVVPLIALSRHIILDKTIYFTFVCIVIFLSLIIYFSKLYMTFTKIHVLTLMLATNSGLLINILNHATDESFESISHIFEVLGIAFFAMLFISLALPNRLIDPYVYMEGKLSLISLILCIFGPYLFMNELSGVLRLIR